MYGRDLNLLRASTPNLGPTPFGRIFRVKASDLSDLNDFDIETTGSTSVVLEDGYIKFSGSPAAGVNYPFVDRIEFKNYITGLSKWSFTVDYIVKSMTTTTEGLAIGFYSDPLLPFERNDWYLHWRDTDNASFNGKVWWANQGTGSNAGYATTTAVTNSIDDEYRMTLDYDNGLYTVTIQNLSLLESENGSAITYTYAYPFGLLDMSSSRMFIGHFNGEHWVSSIELSSTEMKNVDIGVIGTSQTKGYGATTPSNTYFELLKTNNPLLTLTKTAAINDQTSTALNKSSEIALINANKWVVEFPINDIINNSLATVQASYLAFTDELESQGVARENMILLNCPPYNGLANPASFNSWHSGEYLTSPIIDVYSEADNGSGFLNASSDSGDGLHWSDTLNAWIEAQITPLIQ